jgi:hypothetical protein
MGGTRAVHGRRGRFGVAVLVVPFCLTVVSRGSKMKEYIIPFAVAFLAFGFAFLAVDFAIMHAQGLTVIYTH